MTGILHEDREFNDTDASATRVLVVDSGGVPVPPGGGGLTNTQLRATPVPVSGTVTATGPLTDTQLRATPVPVSGTVATTLPTAQRTTSIARVTTATTTNIAAGNRSYTVTVIAAASAASPTLDGVALPAGYTASYSADGANTLEAAAVVTVAGDDVIVLSVT